MSAAGAAVLAPSWLAGQTAAEPPSTVSTPPRDFGAGAPPVTYPDPDLVTVDPAFNGLRIGNTPIQRLWTGALWSEGPAWSSQGRYLVWSDIPNNRQLRWLEDDGRVSVFRAPSNNSNGNTFDFGGRQVSCEHLLRRVVRYEHDGTVTVARRRLRRQTAELAERRRAASRRQLLVHRSAVRRPALRRRARRAGRTEQRARVCCASASVKRPASATRSASCRRTSIASRRTAASRSRSPPTTCRGRRTGSRSRPTTRSSTSSAAATCTSATSPTTAASRRQAVRRLHDRRRRLPHRRRPRRRLRQPLVLEQRRAQRRLQRRHGVEPGRHAARPHSPAGGLRERRVRRAEAQPAVHGREPVAVRGVRQHAGRGARLRLLRRPPHRCHRFPLRSGRLGRQQVDAAVVLRLPGAQSSRNREQPRGIPCEKL